MKYSSSYLLSQLRSKLNPLYIKFLFKIYLWLFNRDCHSLAANGTALRWPGIENVNSLAESELTLKTKHHVYRLTRLLQNYCCGLVQHLVVSVQFEQINRVFFNANLMKSGQMSFLFTFIIIANIPICRLNPLSNFFKVRHINHI